MALGGKREGAGRKQGIQNKLRRELQQMISTSRAKKCLENLALLADGQYLVEKTDKKGKKVIFVAEPNMMANAYLLDQKFGKARQKVEGSIEGGIVIMVNDVTGSE